MLLKSALKAWLSSGDNNSLFKVIGMAKQNKTKKIIRTGKSNLCPHFNSSTVSAQKL